MHDDSTSILRCYTEEAVSKSRREKGNYNGKKKQLSKKQQAHELKEVKSNSMEVDEALETNNENQTIDGSTLAEIPEEELIRELARRKSLKFKLAGAMKRMQNSKKDDIDPTGQVCTLDGRGGTIPCREVME